MATAVNQNSKTSPAMHVLYLLLISATIVSLGALMGFIGGATEGYSGITRPTLTPPDITFSIVWPILYFMMGASFYLTLITTPSNKEEKTIRIVSIVIFFVQLAFNFTWTPIFFKARLYFSAFAADEMRVIADVRVVMYAVPCGFKRVNLPGCDQHFQVAIHGCHPYVRKTPFYLFVNSVHVGMRSRVFKRFVNNLPLRRMSYAFFIINLSV